jgi:phosphatidylinositol-3-phosphatase
MVKLIKLLHSGFILTLILTLLSACVPAAPLAVPIPTQAPLPTNTLTPVPTKTFTPAPSRTLPPSPTASPSPTPEPLVPDFTHIIVIMFENKEFNSVIGNSKMRAYNRWAGDYTLLTDEFAIMHPSLPNYIALIGGDTFGITSDNPKISIDSPSLPDLIEASGRTWKAYMESMPTPCQTTDTLLYVIKHNPFVWFKPIVDNKTRCQNSIVPLTQLDSDLRAHTLPNYVFIMPNSCNSAHDSYIDPENCDVNVADGWLDEMLKSLWGYGPIEENGLIIVTWDEGQGDHNCCGLTTGGGRVPTILISSKAKKGFLDDTPYTHYSILKTIETAWSLKQLGHAADPQNVLIEAPWIK